LAETTRSFKGPLEQRFDAMMGSLGISKWALLELKECAEAYEQDDPEIGWITELLQAQKLAVATVRELEFDARRLHGAQRSLISGIISGPILKWALLDDPEMQPLMWLEKPSLLWNGRCGRMKSGQCRKIRTTGEDQFTRGRPKAAPTRKEVGKEEGEMPRLAVRPEKISLHS
jgi:hypothetical protein